MNSNSSSVVSLPQTSCIHSVLHDFVAVLRTPVEANMPLRYTPRKPYSSLYFEVAKHLKSGSHQEWRKYVIGI